ncbi:FAD-binding domain-containing protein [Lactarius akahatsu]|uniref:FAD-binding domain-containing protein n=1 Tax=Lactarius akahatsu TaxID=416441 RepID=A0AAD4LBY9_9AGAM|nr:FAD-binding domain-containing protein [Lactarius akahatsu]
MLSLFLSVTAVVLAISLTRPVQVVYARCRNQPGDPGYPAAADWSTLNNTIGGRLLRVVPSVEACRKLGCTEAQWASGIFRQTIPGAMNAYNWEQDYTPPAELCLLNGTTCAQGNVPLYAVNATIAQHIQAGVRFARAHDLRVVIKSSGHDYLGRSTAKNSLLLWTAYFRDITFTDHFLVGGADQGSAVTVGSGVGLKNIYAAAKAQNKMFVGGTAATVSAAGGYTQGAGHSAFSPIYGLAADNVLQYSVVLANGSYVVVNSASFPNLFWALRGGGAGSWGVIIDATFRTFPIFSATLHTVNLLTATVEQTGDLMTLHAKHISDWDNVRAGQYFYLTGSATNSTLALNTVFKGLDGNSSKAQMSAFLSNATALGAIVQGESTITAAPNDIVGFPDDQSGYNVILSSRLIPKSIYVHSPSSVGAAYKQLLSQGIRSVLGHLVAGGQVSANANIDSAIHPAWRVAKTHLIATQLWDDTLAAADVLALRRNFTSIVRPVLAGLAGGPSSGSYSNEGDVLEPNPQVTYYGPNYARLKSIKAIYDPNDLFIVPTGVRSEIWNADGTCTV